MATKVIMPQLGESVVEGTVTAWLRREGQPVEEFEALLEVNTDKVNTEIPSPATGMLLKVLVAEGETVAVGKALAWIGQPGEAIPEREEMGEEENERSQAMATAETARDTQPVTAAQGRSHRDVGFISPVVARMAEEHGIDLYEVPGTGEGGRITRRDVQAFLERRAQPDVEAEPGAPAPWETPGEGDLFRPTELMFPGKWAEGEPAVPAEETPAAQPGQLISLSPIRQRIAQHMVQSKQTSPHVTSVMEANLARVSAHRQANKALYSQSGVNLTFTAYFVSAAVAALKAYPMVNSSWTAQGIQVHAAFNFGVAVSLGEEGLIVPVIQHADRLSLLGLARAINDLAVRARRRQLNPDEVHGGTFSITNHGTGGSLFATPIINQPQAGILGVGAIQKRVVVIEEAIAVRPMVYLSFTFDHRILDGATADGFLGKVVSVLEEWN
ncbi:MAG TPA: dihydrolipoamide acetyltransferase family protein [Levilinea sp.]|nr:dihydrolipoamide acetyltransferase family protein [Levilinea sp.]